jgi:hypothetical protein
MQAPMSDSLGWGYLMNADGTWQLDAQGKKTSSLCNAMSILTAADLNNMIDTTPEMKKAFLNYAKDTLKVGNSSYIEKNGYVNADFKAFTAAYVEYMNLNFLKEKSPVNKMQAPTWGESSKFGVGRNTAIMHSVVIDRYAPTNASSWRQPFFNPSAYFSSYWYEKKPFLNY